LQNIFVAPFISHILTVCQFRAARGQYTEMLLFVVIRGCRTRSI